MMGGHALSLIFTVIAATLPEALIVKNVGVPFALASILTFLAGLILLGYFMGMSLKFLAEDSRETTLKDGGMMLMMAIPTLVIVIGYFLQALAGLMLLISFERMRPPQKRKLGEKTLTDLDVRNSQ